MWATESASWKLLIVQNYTTTGLMKILFAAAATSPCRYYFIFEELIF
jgi:hypothetical protein